MLLLHILSVIGLVIGVLCLFTGIKLAPSKDTDMLLLLGVILPLLSGTGAHKFNIENNFIFYIFLIISMLLLIFIALLLLCAVLLWFFEEKIEHNRE